MWLRYFFGYWSLKWSLPNRIMRLVTGKHVYLHTFKICRMDLRNKNKNTSLVLKWREFMAQIQKIQYSLAWQIHRRIGKLYFSSSSHCDINTHLKSPNAPNLKLWAQNAYFSKIWGIFMGLNRLISLNSA